MSKEKKKKSGLGKFIAGVAIGTGIGVLFAPKKGSETRAELKEKMQELYKKAKELDMDEVKENIEIIEVSNYREIYKILFNEKSEKEKK